MFNIGKLKELIKDLYLKISFMCCCKSNCTLQIGHNEVKAPPPSPSNDDNHIDEQRGTFTSTL